MDTTWTNFLEAWWMTRYTSLLFTLLCLENSLTKMLQKCWYIKTSLIWHLDYHYYLATTVSCMKLPLLYNPTLLIWCKILARRVLDLERGSTIIQFNTLYTWTVLWFIKTVKVFTWNIIEYKIAYIEHDITKAQVFTHYISDCVNAKLLCILLTNNYIYCGIELPLFGFGGDNVIGEHVDKQWFKCDLGPGK